MVSQHRSGLWPIEYDDMRMRRRRRRTAEEINGERLGGFDPLNQIAKLHHLVSSARTIEMAQRPMAWIIGQNDESLVGLGDWPGAQPRNNASAYCLLQDALSTLSGRFFWPHDWQLMQEWDCFHWKQTDLSLSSHSNPLRHRDRCSLRRRVPVPVNKWRHGLAGQRAKS